MTRRSIWVWGPGGGAPRGRSRATASSANVRLDRSWALFAFAVAMLGCGETRSHEATPVARSESAVVAGEPSPLGGREDGVLLMRTELDGAEIVCSASLVASNLALTARHCVSHLVRGLFRCTVQGALQSDDPGAGRLGMHLDATALEFYDGKTPRTEPIAHGTQVLSTLSETICVNDIAFVVLDQAVSLPVLPLRLAGRPVRGEPVSIVGYGFDDAMAEGQFLDVATQLRTHNTALEIGDVGPADEADVTTAPPRSIVVDGPAGCIGDSGGPLLARDTGAVLGVYSLLDGVGCLAPDARNLFAAVPDFRQLTTDAFAAADSDPTPEPRPSEPGQAGASGSGGETGDSNGGAPAAGGAPADGGRGTTNTAGATAEGGAPHDAGGTGGAVGQGASGESSSTAGEAAQAPSPKPRAPAHASGGCSLSPSSAPAVPLPLLALVSILERIFRVRRLARRRGPHWLRGPRFR